MSRDRAAYMREYRAKERQARQNVTALLTNSVPDMVLRIRELEAEVARLKRELAKPLRFVSQIPEDTFNTRPFTPVPKKR